MDSNINKQCYINALVKFLCIIYSQKMITEVVPKERYIDVDEFTYNQLGQIKWHPDQTFIRKLDTALYRHILELIFLTE